MNRRLAVELAFCSSLPELFQDFSCYWSSKFSIFRSDSYCLDAVLFPGILYFLSIGARVPR